MPERDLVCFQCSQPIGDPPQLNDMADGEPCPACRDRLLDQLAPIFHVPIEVGGAVLLDGQRPAVEGLEGVPGLRLVEDGPEDEYPA